MYDELKKYWDVLIEELPVLEKTPHEMRDHNCTDDSGTHDCIYFWPIGQELLAQISRKLLDRQPDPDKPTIESIKKALAPLKFINSNFKDVPWKHLLLIPDDEDWTSWKIRNEDRNKVANLAIRIVQWQIGLDQLSEDEIKELKNEWKPLLLPALKDDLIDSLWEKIEEGVHR